MLTMSNSKEEILAILNSSDDTGELKTHAMVALLAIERAEWFEYVMGLEKKFNQDALSKLIKIALLEKIEKLRQYREGIYGLNDELRAKGVPFEERKKQLKLERISLCERKESELADHVRRFRARPLSEWLGRFDLRMAKGRGVGMSWIIGYNLEHTYVVPNQN